MSTNVMSFDQRIDRAATLIVGDSTIDINGAGKPDSVRTVLHILAEHGLLTFGFSNPEVSGPQTGDLERATAVIKILARYSGTLASIFMVAGFLGPACVSAGGTSEQKHKILPGCAAGEIQLAFAMTEPHAGSDAAAMSTQAREVSNGFCLTGEKIYITGAATADWVLTVAKTAEDNSRSFGIFFASNSLDGLEVEPLRKLSGNAYPSCAVRFDAVTLSADAVLGGSGSLTTAWPTLRDCGSWERLLVSAMACGLATAATAKAAEFITQRDQFGRKIKDFQAVQHSVVEAHTLTSGMCLYLDHALQAFAADKEAVQEVSMAKYFCSEQLQRVVEIAVRIGGGRSYFDFDPVSRYYREAPFTLFAGGTVEIQKMLIARTLGI